MIATNDKLHDCMAAWSISQKILSLDLGLPSRYEWVQQREIAEAKRSLLAAIKRWTQAEDRFSTEGRKYVQNRLEDYLSETSLRLSDAEKQTIGSELWLKVHDQLNGDLQKMKCDLLEIDRALAKWGDVKPVEVHYREIVKKVWLDRLRVLGVLGLVNVVLAIMILGLGLPIWLVALPVVLSTLYFLVMVVGEHSEYGRLYFRNDQELREYAQNRRKRRTAR